MLKMQKRYLGFGNPDGLILLAVDGLAQLPVPSVALRERDRRGEHVRPQFLEFHALLVQLLAALVRRPGCHGKSAQTKDDSVKSDSVLF